MIRWISQGLGAVKEIKVLGRQEFFVNALRKSGDSLASALAQTAMMQQIPRLAVETIAVCGLVGVILIHVLSERDVYALLPVLGVIAVATARLVPSVSRFISASSGFRFIAPSIEVALKDLEQAGSTAAKQTTNKIVEFQKMVRVASISYDYPESVKPALDNIGFDIEFGESVALVGESGAGKTTLVNVVLGLLSPSSGRVSIDGTDMLEDVTGWQRQIVYIPQEIYLTDDTVRRNVGFGLPDGEIDDEMVWRSLEAAQLARIDHRFGNEGDFGRPERFSESFAIDPVQVE